MQGHCTTGRNGVRKWGITVKLSEVCRLVFTTMVGHAIHCVGPHGTSGFRRSRTTYISLDSDYFTRWPEAYATADHKTATVASKLINERVPCFGVMQHLHTDKGQYFKSTIFQNLTDKR